MIRLIVLLLLSTTCFAQELRLCRSPYALMSPSFKYQEYKNGTKGIGKYTVATLWNTFGNKLQNYSAELADPNVIGTETALLNETCVTRGDCGPYEALAGYTTRSLGEAIDRSDAKLKNKIEGEAKRLADFLLPRLRSDQFCVINPLLETHQNQQRVARVNSWVMPFFNGRCQSAWNPAGGRPGPVPPTFDYSEGHGDSPKFNDSRCIANPDGTLIEEPNYPPYLRKYGQQCRFGCTWGLNDNCNAPGQPRMDPRRRPCKSTGEFAMFNRVMKKAQSVGSVPPWDSNDDKSLVNCKVYPTNDGDRKGFLWKQGDNKPNVAILFPVEFGKFDTVIVQKAGKKVGTFTYFYKYTEDGSNRAVWRGPPNLAATDYPPNVVVRGITGNKVSCWKISDPSIRND